MAAFCFLMLLIVPKTILFLLQFGKILKSKLQLDQKSNVKSRINVYGNISKANTETHTHTANKDFLGIDAIPLDIFLLSTVLLGKIFSPYYSSSKDI